MSDIVAGITNHLIGRDYGLYIQGADAQSVSKSSLLRHVTTDGLCVLLSGPLQGRRSILKRIIATHQPVVLFQEVLPAAIPDVCVFRQDDRGGALALARLVLRPGPQRLAMLTTSWEWPSLTQRELGIRDAIAERGSPATLDLIACDDGNFRATVAALAAYIAEHGLPDAILAGSDPMGVAAIRHLQGRGLRVPEDVVVTGFGAFDASRYSDPVLTSVRSPAYELGAQGVAALLERLETGAFRTSEVVLPVEVVPGGSTLPESDQAAGKQGSAKLSSGAPSHL
jgi:LacI family transcriptional regulator